MHSDRSTIEKELPMSQMTVRAATTPDHRRARTEAIEAYFAAIKAGDHAALDEVLAPDAVTLWPQSNERIVGAASCMRVYENYPGGPPKVRLQRVRGEDATWVAESTADYGDERWHIISVFEFDDARIASITDIFGPSLPAPDWRRQWVEVDRGPALAPEG